MISILWITLSLAIFFYSYGFVDLNLTLSSNPLLFKFVTAMQHLIYFDRPLSLKIFIGIVLGSFVLYGLTLWTSHAQKILNFPWKLIAVIALIAALSYPMLSSDVFKYLFGAKEILVYHANPYVVTPNTFSDDTWIRFMRWVHTTSPYGPVFIGLTIPYYLMGLGKFVPILYLFKLDQIFWYFLTIYLIGKITSTLNWSKIHITQSQLFFALNPLILMEWLVNAHNDAIMVSLLLASIYFYLSKKTTYSWLTLLLSIGIKYITAIFLPLLALSHWWKPKFELVVYYLLATLFLAPILYHYSWQYQPWYVTWLIPIVSLTKNGHARLVVGAYSLSVFTRYLFFVGTGSWLGTPLWHASMTFALPGMIMVFGIARQCLTRTRS